MGGGKKSKAPAAPDYAALAKQQAAGDRETAQYLTEANRVNQYSPQGSITWNKAVNPAIQSELARLTGIARATTGNPTARAQVEQQIRDLEAKNTTWSQYMNLSPEEQQIFNAEQGNRLGMEGLTSTAIGRAGQTLGSDWNPQLTGIPEYTGMEANRQALPGLRDPNVGLPLENLYQMGLVDNNMGRQYSDDAARALYQKQTMNLDEAFGQQEAKERQRLASMGLQEGSEAYNRAIDQFQRNRGQTYQQASLDSTLKGYDVGNQQLSNLLNIRENNAGLMQGVFNQGAQRYGMDQGERALRQGVERDIYSLDQNERQLQSGANLARAQQAGNVRQQLFGEQAYARSLPINEISALLNGGGVQMPQMPQYAQATPFQSADILGAAQAGYGARMGQYNAQQSQKGSLLGAGASLGGAFLGMK